MALGFSPESSPSAFYPYTSPSSTCFPSLLEPDLQLFSNYHQPNYPRPSVPSFEQPGGACSPYRQISRNTPNHKAFAPANHCTTPRRLTWESLDPSAPAVDLTASSPIGQSRRHSLDRLFESLSPVSHFSEGDRESYPPPHTYDPHQRPSIMGKRRQSLTSQSQPSSSHSSRSHPAKRCKRNDDPPGRSDSTSASHPPLEIESIDLTEVEDKSILADALLKRREDAVRAQINRSGAGDDAGRSSLTSYKCPVCMDVLEDATTTICGRFLCLQLLFILHHHDIKYGFLQVICSVINVSSIPFALGRNGREPKDSASRRESALYVGKP